MMSVHMEKPNVATDGIGRRIGEEHTMITYLPYDTPTREHPLPWQSRGLQQTVSGYGLHLTTSQQAQYNGKWYRVYAACISNVASFWIETKGQRLYLHS